MESLTLRGVTAEIAKLAGRRLDAVEGVDPHTVRLKLGADAVLWISVHPRHPTMFLTRESPESSEGFSIPFLRLAGSSLTGARLSGASQAGLDRIAAVSFEVRDRLGDVVHRHLVVELIGSAADLVLVDGKEPFEGRILGRLRGRGSERAESGSGAGYELPLTPKPDVTRADDADLLAAAARSHQTHGPGPGALVRAWMGVSPAVAREIRHRAEDPEVLGDLVAAWRDLVDSTRPTGAQAMAESSFAPTLVTRPDDTVEVHCFVPHAPPVLPHVSYPTLSDALAEAYGRFREGELARGRPAPLRAVLGALDRVERGLAALDREAEETGSAETYRRHGEAVLAQAHAIPRGVTEAEIPDPRTGDRIRIRLNPRLAAAENAELLFKKARKAARREPAQRERREALHRQRAALVDLRERLARFEGGEPDAAWIRDAEARGVRLPREETAGLDKPRPESRLPASLRPRQYDLGGGWRALVGRSNRGNDILTVELARPDDYWMHAHQAAGSHLVLRHDEKGKEPPRPVILAAAAIAAYFSKARGSSKVPVLVSQKRHVRKPRNAPVGTVSVSRYETVMVQPRCPDQEEHA